MLDSSHFCDFFRCNSWVPGLVGWVESSTEDVELLFLSIPLMGRCEVVEVAMAEKLRAELELGQCSHLSALLTRPGARYVWQACSQFPVPVSGLIGHNSRAKTRHNASCLHHYSNDCLVGLSSGDPGCFFFYYRNRKIIICCI